MKVFKNDTGFNRHRVIHGIDILNLVQAAERQQDGVPGIIRNRTADKRCSTRLGHHRSSGFIGDTNHTGDFFRIGRAHDHGLPYKPFGPVYKERLSCLILGQNILFTDRRFQFFNNFCVHASTLQNAKNPAKDFAGMRISACQAASSF